MVPLAARVYDEQMCLGTSSGSNQQAYDGHIGIGCKIVVFFNDQLPET
jgi:hypothetical protein